ncbi:MAG: YdjY domain-containing protein, partial [Planctomycetota bacterium]
MICRRPAAVAAASCLLLAGCAGNGVNEPGMVADAGRCEVRLSGVVQKTDAPRMNGFAAATPALLGSRGGDYEKFFVFLVDTPVTAVHDALVRVGARARVVYKLEDLPPRKGLGPDTRRADYMQGDPVQIHVEWKADGRTVRRAYEDFFLQEMEVGGARVVKPWTPHLVFHGSGVLNGKKTGCIACVHDCPGGII